MARVRTRQLAEGGWPDDGRVRRCPGRDHARNRRHARPSRRGHQRRPELRDQQALKRRSRKPTRGGKLPRTIQRLAREDAQTMAEYVVVLGVITLAIVTTFATMSGAIQTVLGRSVGLFSSMKPAGPGPLLGAVPGGANGLQ